MAVIGWSLVAVASFRSVFLQFFPSLFCLSLSLLHYFMLPAIDIELVTPAADPTS